MSISSMTNAAIVRRSDNRFHAPDGHNGTARDIDAAAAVPVQRDGSLTQAGPADTTLDVLFRYIPTEILTVYLAVVAALQPAAGAATTVATVCLGTHLSGHGTLKDAQGALRHASITTTGNVYVQVVEENVMRAVNSHASTVLEGWTPAVESMGLTGRNVKRLPEPFLESESNLVKFRRGGLLSA